MITEIILGLQTILLLGLVIGFVILWRDKKGRNSKEEFLEFENKILEFFSERTERFLQETSSLKEITRALQDVTLRELNRVQENLDKFSSLRELFVSPKLRGNWGEATLEYLLSHYFPPEFYQIQYSFPTGEKVDAVLLLPNKKILPIDSKFPLDVFARLKEAETEAERKKHRGEFILAVKKLVDDVSKKYIQPDYNTVDFALVYIPAEQVFYELAFNIKEENLLRYGWDRRVILTSPNTLYPTLRTVLHWIRDVRLSEQTQEILKRLERLRIDALKLKETFSRFRKHFSNAYNSLEKLEERVDLFEKRASSILSARADQKQGIIEEGTQMYLEEGKER